MIGTGLVPLFLYETEFNAPHVFVFRYLAIPVLVAAYILLYVWRRRWRALTLLDLLMPGMLGLMVVLWLGSVVLWPNALLGAQRPEAITGPVIDRFKPGAKSKAYVLAIARPERHDTIRLKVPKETFDTAALGSEFRTEMTRGSLGLLYRRR